jgi:hypothetical protein
MQEWEHSGNFAVLESELREISNQISMKEKNEAQRTSNTLTKIKNLENTAERLSNEFPIKVSCIESLM